MKTLYFDCFAGASGNMILGALIALGVDEKELVKRLFGLSVADFTVESSRVDRSGIFATHVNVVVPTETSHRHLHQIEKIIDESNLSQQVKDRSKAIFGRLAEAEATVHGIEVQKVHFHEVGALDAIVDVVGCCICFELLGIASFACSKINVGNGFVKMQHGTYPVPPPAVLNLMAGIPIYSTDVQGELLTPTGAAIIATLSTVYGPLPEMVVERSGYGAGSREYDDFPNVLRLIIGETAEQRRGVKDEIISENLILLETNVDDMSGQVVGFVLERALDLGALDCWAAPIQMKKNRPASLISVLCAEAVRPLIADLLFTETTTLGIRSKTVDRVSLPREIHTVETRYGKIDVKTAVYKGRTINVMPEYEQVKEAALKHSTPFRQVHSEAIACFNGLARSVAK